MLFESRVENKHSIPSSIDIRNNVCGVLEPAKMPCTPCYENLPYSMCASYWWNGPVSGAVVLPCWSVFPLSLFVCMPVPAVFRRLHVHAFCSHFFDLKLVLFLQQRSGTITQQKYSSTFLDRYFYNSFLKAYGDGGLLRHILIEVLFQW